MDPSMKEGDFPMTAEQYFGIFWFCLPVIFFILGLQAAIVKSAHNRHRNQDIFPYAWNRSQITEAPVQK